MTTTKRPTSIRVSEQARQIMKELSAQLGVSESAVMELALRQLYKKENQNNERIKV